MYSGYEFIYTDGSKDVRVASAAVMEDHAYTERLPDKSSIYTAELNALYLALDHVETSTEKNFVIFSDSKSSLQSLSTRDWKNPMVRNILERFYRLCYQDRKIVVFCWVPSHIGIKGNEKADTAAKEATKLKIVHDKIPFTDFRCYINRYIRIYWQVKWDELENNKLRAAHPHIGLWTQAFRKSRREETVLTRLRIGHSYLTHSYLLKSEDQPECIPCNCPLTIKHIMLDCIDFSNTRSKYYEVNNMQELFETINATTILNYIQDIGLFHKL